MKIKIENRSQLEIKYGKFVDREKERQQFWNQYDSLCEMSDEWNVTVFDYYEVELMMVTTATEIQNPKEALDLIEKLEQVADHDNEDADRLLLRCQLEKSNSLSKSGNPK